jgi:hypothetical protein
MSARKLKVVRETWKTTVEMDAAMDAVRLYSPFEGKIWLGPKFNAGDGVEVTVRLLPRKSKP